MKGQERVAKTNENKKSLSTPELNLSSKLEFPCVEYMCTIGKMMSYISQKLSKIIT